MHHTIQVCYFAFIRQKWQLLTSLVWRYNAGLAMVQWAAAKWIYGVRSEVRFTRQYAPHGLTITWWFIHNGLPLSRLFLLASLHVQVMRFDQENSDRSASSLLTSWKPTASRQSHQQTSQANFVQKISYELAFCIPTSYYVYGETLRFNLNV